MKYSIDNYINNNSFFYKKSITLYTPFDKYSSIIIKGVAIILVILCHLGGKTGSVVFTPLGGIGVAIFLFLSGYGLEKSYEKKGLNNYWKKKISYVFLPYLAIELVASGAGLITYKSIINFILDIYYLHKMYPS